MSSMTLTEGSAGPTASALSQRGRGFLTKARAILEAVREGHRAARRYRQLTASGVAQNEAAKRVFVEIYTLS